MKTKDLRIGNYLLIDGIPCSIENSLGRKLFGNYEIDGVEFQRFKPIPLTEEWILKFGYDKVGIDFINKSRYSLYKPVEYVGYLFCEGNLILREIKHVHQLQNLYFALTNEELTIKTE